MRIVCPSCQSAYDVPAPVLAARRTLRCARCSADFMPEAETADFMPEAETVGGVAPSAEAPPSAKPFVSIAPDLPMDPPAVSANRESELERLALLARVGPIAPARSPAAAVAIGWVLSAVALAAIGWAILGWRVPIMQAWPPSTRLYAAIGYLR